MSSPMGGAELEVVMDELKVVCAGLKDLEVITPASVAVLVNAIADEARSYVSGAAAQHFERVLREGAEILAEVEMS
jgi:hypothetical protein